MKVYLSATYQDLVAYREAAYHQLRRMRHDVIGMEDYVAADQRPLDRCLEDVAQCDVYVGIFGWRYGFIPPRGNPQKRSITELEYRKARALKKHCLIFLLKEDAPWPPTLTDSHTGEGSGGVRIKELRAELGQEHVVSTFTTPDGLASAVAVAIFGVRDGAAMVRQHELPAGPAQRRAASAKAQPRSGHEVLWKPGSVLRVRFLQDNPAFEMAVRRFLPVWSAYANVRFEFSQDEDAEVRVGFEQDGSNWAYVGTDCLRAPHDQATVNFSFLEPPEICVLHEFGHVLGLQHEHNHPKGPKWNKTQVVKAMGGPPNNWDKHTIESNMFGRWDPHAFPVEKPFDPVSIMAYPMPREWTGLGTDFGYRDGLSPGDKEFVEKLYPFDAA